MFCKIPKVARCCFCLPLRQGILTFGYLNIIISLIGLPILIFLAVEGMATEDIFKNDIFKVHEEEPKILTIAFTALDIIVTTILLFGVHKKKKNLLKVYFYTGLVFQILPLFIDVIFLQTKTVLGNFSYFFCTGLNFYMLFLVYNLMHTIEVVEEISPAMEYTNYNEKTNLYV